MTLDDFEWVELGFDEHVLIHKTHELTVASIRHFGGWQLWVLTPPKGSEKVGDLINDLESAKVVAMINVSQNMKGYSDVLHYRARTPNPRPKKVPRGVFKVDKPRS